MVTVTTAQFTNATDVKGRIDNLNNPKQKASRAIRLTPEGAGTFFSQINAGITLNSPLIEILPY